MFLRLSDFSFIWKVLADFVAVGTFYSQVQELSLGTLIYVRTSVLFSGQQYFGFCWMLVSAVYRNVLVGISSNSLFFNAGNAASAILLEKTAQPPKDSIPVFSQFPF